MSNKYGLTEDQLSIQEMAKKFADEVVAETVTDLDARHAFPEEEVKQCAEMGSAHQKNTAVQEWIT